MALCAGFKGAVLGLGFRVYGSVASEMREAFDELYPAMEKLDDPGFQVYWKSVVQIPQMESFTKIKESFHMCYCYNPGDEPDLTSDLGVADKKWLYYNPIFAGCHVIDCLMQGGKHWRSRQIVVIAPYRYTAFECDWCRSP